MTTAFETEDVPKGAPTPDEIRVGCLAIQATWSDEEFFKRAGFPAPEHRTLIIPGTARVAWRPSQTDKERLAEVNDLIAGVLAGLGPRRPKGRKSDLSNIVRPSMRRT